MKRLFQVTLVNGAVQYFDKKPEAKMFRDAHGGSKLSKGPDHRNYAI